MSAAVGPVLFAVAGLALCSGLGMVHARPLNMVAGLGLAYLVGVAAVTALETALLVVGVPLLPAVAVAVVACVLAGVLSGIRHGSWRADNLEHERTSWARLAWIVPAVVFGAAAVLGAIYAAQQPVISWDGWSIYARKAIWLASAGNLDARLFTEPTYVFMHQDYPLTMPLMEALPAKLDPASGGAGLLNGWLVLAAYPWAVGYLALQRLRNRAWAIPVVLLTLAPACFRQGLTGYADLPMAVLLGTGVLLLAIWLRDPDGGRASLAIACLLLVGGANTKNEGLLFAALALMLAFVVVALQRERRRAVELAIAGLGAAVLLAPWRVWLAVHDIRGEFSFASGLDPGFLADHSDRARTASNVLAQAVSVPGWRWLLIGAVAVSLVGMTIPFLRSIALYHLALGIGAFGALVWIYTIDRQDLGWHLANSADRVITVIPFIAASAIVHVTAPAPRA
jgi:hypothetical protein